MRAHRSKPVDDPIMALDVTSADSADTWADPDGPVPPRPKNRIVRAGVIICACGFFIAILGVAQLAEQKNHATLLAEVTHKTGLLTMFTGFMAMLIGFRHTQIRSRIARLTHRQSIRHSIKIPAELDWRETPWRTS